MTGPVTPAIPAQLEAPEPIYNCPDCSHYLPAGTLACPDCHAIIYAGHLRDIALQATSEEHERKWAEARATWVKALDWLPPGTKQAEAVQAKITALDQRSQAELDWRAKWTKRLGPFAPVLFFLAKIKSLFFLLFKLKFLLSFVAFFGIYWALFGWKFGLGFTLSILVHEMGHYLVAKSKGLRVDLPVFLPGLGAYVRWYQQGMSLESLAQIALAGPFFGLIFATICAAIATFARDPYLVELFSALTHVTAWLNVLNLTPVLGLDGAQATYALDRTQRWLVLATALIFFGLLHELMFLAVAAGMAWRLWRGGYAAQPSTRTLFNFVLLLFTLGLMMLRFPAPEQLAR
jgi:Zn-dependent protease